MEVHGWVNTRNALKKLENLLECGVCKRTVMKACTLGGCEHFFCQECMDELKGNVCPTCKMPSHVKDVETARQLDTAAMLCKQLSRLVGELDTDTATSLPDTSAHSIDDLQNFLLHENLPQVTESEKCTKPKRNSKGRPVKLDDLRASTETSAQSFEVLQNTKTLENEAHTEPKLSVRPKRTSRGKKTGTSASVTSAESIENLEDIIPKLTKTTQPKPKRTSRGKKAQSDDASSFTTPVQSKPRRSRTKKSPADLPATPEPTTGSGKPEAKDVPFTPSSQPWISPGFSTPVSRRLGLGPGPSPGGSCMTGSPAVGKKNTKGETPLQVACIKGDVRKVEQLLIEGACPNTRDNAGWTPLHEACNHGYHEIAGLLLDAGAVINMAGGAENDTPLHDAVSNSHIHCIKLLVSRGASRTQRNVSGKSPMDLGTTKSVREALATHVIQQYAALTQSQVPSLQEPQQIVVVTTGLDRELRSKVQKCVQMLHGKLVADFSDIVSHVVTGVNKSGQCPRTMKYLQGVITGKWIVTIDWISTCLEYKERVSEEPFEVPGASNSPDSMAPSRSRLNHLQQLPGLFTGCQFYLLGEFAYPTPPKEDLVFIIKAGGGILLTREPKPDIISQSEVTVPYHMTTDSQLQNCSYFIIQDKIKQSKQVNSWLMKTSPAWILDCVGSFRLVHLKIIL